MPNPVMRAMRAGKVAADHGRSRIGGQAITYSGVQAIDREVTHPVSRTATLSP